MGRKQRELTANSLSGKRGAAHYPLWVLILVLGLRKGEALGLIEPDGDWRTDEDGAVIDLEW